MDYKKIEKELKKEEQDLLDEIIELQKKIEDVDPAKMNGQLMESIQQVSIETITNSLGVSDAFEFQAHHNPGSLKKEDDRFNEHRMNYSNDEEALRNYNTEIIDKTEFTAYRKRTDNLVSNRELYTEKKIKGETIEGRSMKETTDMLHNDSQSKGGVEGAFNGLFMKNGEKDPNKKYTWDHGDPVKEVATNRVLNDFTTLKERRDYVNSEAAAAEVVAAADAAAAKVVADKEAAAAKVVADKEAEAEAAKAPKEEAVAKETEAKTEAEPAKETDTEDKKEA